MSYSFGFCIRGSGFLGVVWGYKGSAYVFRTHELNVRVSGSSFNWFSRPRAGFIPVSGLGCLGFCPNVSIRSTATSSSQTLNLSSSCLRRELFNYVDTYFYKTSMCTHIYIYMYYKHIHIHGALYSHPRQQSARGFDGIPSGARLCLPLGF